MAKKSKKVAGKQKAKASVKPIEQYEHLDKERVNNPHIGLVNESTDTEYGQNKKKYQYDPHLDPQLQWAGKAERISFEVPTVSLHVHERIDPKTIIDSVKADAKNDDSEQLSLFEKDKKPLREAIEFYKHKEGWSNRLIAGDSLLIMNSLLEKEGMGGKVQMVYFDPPYGIKYGSNFQPFVNKRDVKDGSDEDLTQEPEMIKAFRDTWELGIHSYLSYLRDRTLLARELLHESGSLMIQISDENIHHVKEIMDEVFGSENFVSLITFVKTAAQSSHLLPGVVDYIVWYAKDKSKIKYRALFKNKMEMATAYDAYSWLLMNDGTVRKASISEIENPPVNCKLFRLSPLVSQNPGSRYDVDLNGKKYRPEPGYWKTDPTRMDQLIKLNRIHESGKTLFYRMFFDDFPAVTYSNTWNDTQASFGDKVYVVQTATKVIQRCMLMTTDPGDLTLDITCGSGTTAFVAEQWGRRWITCDTSRVAVALAKQRLITNIFDFYPFAQDGEGISSGFQYKTVPHITMKSVANNEPPGMEVGSPIRSTED